LDLEFNLPRMMDMVLPAKGNKVLGFTGNNHIVQIQPCNLTAKGTKKRRWTAIHKIDIIVQMSNIQSCSWTPAQLFWVQVGLPCAQDITLGE
jgi:hypothetical protein